MTDQRKPLPETINPELSDRKERLRRAMELCRQRKIVIPTFAQQKDPSLIPEKIVQELQRVGLWDVHVRNLFRITWKNDPATGGFGGVNFLELPRELTGVPARIFALVGKFFPTGAHKVGATFGCLVPRLITGTFDPTSQKAVWPSTGNFCRGGAYVAKLLGCESVAILPEGMSRERFDWLKSIGSEVIATPGCESNVKEIYDKCWELRAERGDAVVVMNQFEEFGNALWHYEVTASAIEEAFQESAGSGEKLFAYVSSTGSAGTIGAGDRLKELHPALKIVASEALQCPTLLRNGFGDHRIEGIGDKHVPWIHNVRNTDMVVAIDDEAPMALLSLFNEPAGRHLLQAEGVPEETIQKLDLMGISGIANMLSAIKVAKWYELDEKDAIFTILTDSVELYGSRLEEARKAHGEYTPERARLDFRLHLRGQKLDNIAELGHWDKNRIHNLKYYTWIEQQRRNLEELQAQWHDHKNYWPARLGRAPEYDRLIEKFNEHVGVLKSPWTAPK